MDNLLLSLEQADKAATLWINSHHTPVMDQVWLFFSDKVVWIPFYIAIIAILVIHIGWKKALLGVIAVALAVTLCDQFANIVKDAAQRLRPNKDVWMIENGLHILEKGGKYGFFSAHAANTLALAASTAGLVRMKNNTLARIYVPTIFVWASLVSISRIFVAKHFLGDVVVGAAVGGLIGFLLFYGAKRLYGLLHLDAA